MNTSRCTMFSSYIVQRRCSTSLFRSGQDVYEVMREHSDIFDTSNYPVDHPLFTKVNKRVAGKFKDECASQNITSVIALKPKLYSIMVEKTIEENLVTSLKEVQQVTCKGVVRAVRDRYLRHCLFEKTLEKLEEFYVRQRTIRSREHVLQTVQQCKLAITGYDLKRYLVNGIETRALGHYKND